jgi:mannose-6-phosphate isomerase class I
MKHIERGGFFVQQYGRDVVPADKFAHNTLDAEGGVVRLAPAWVPRAFCTPGRRLKLHPHDYFPFEKGRGGVDERWFASAVRADNGPQSGPYEGLSLVVTQDGTLIPLDEFVAATGKDFLGERMWDEYGRWPMFSKFFDNLAPLPLHIHLRDEHARLVGKRGKDEAYYFAPQMNNYPGQLPVTFFGLNPGTTKEQVAECLRSFKQGGDNRILELSRGYKITAGTGWNVPAGILHAPASMCTYEPQQDCDVYAMFESWSNNREVGEDVLWKDVPEEKRGDVDFLVDIVDWEASVDSQFKENRYMEPVETGASQASGGVDYADRWVVYRNEHFSAKELTILPGRSAVIKDQDPYGIICVQGHGTINGQELSSPSMIRYGALTRDEYFVSAPAAQVGVTFTNAGEVEPLVMLRHYGPDNVERQADKPWE